MPKKEKHDRPKLWGWKGPDFARFVKRFEARGPEKCIVVFDGEFMWIRSLNVPVGMALGAHAEDEKFDFVFTCPPVCDLDELMQALLG